MTHVFITGATGFIGSQVAMACRQRGVDVVGLARPGSFVDVLRRLGCRVVVGDMDDVDALRSGARGASAVVHLAAATSEGTLDPAVSERVNVGGMANLIAACQQEGVRRLVSVSTQSTKRDTQGAYGRTKQRADELLMGSGLDWTILKPTLVYGPGRKGIFAKLVALVQGLPCVPVIGDGQCRTQPVFVGDVAAAVVASLTRDGSIGRVYDIAGADRFTFDEFIARIQTALQQRKKTVHVPVWLALSIARLGGLIMPRPPVTQDNVLGVTQETQVDLEPARRDLDFRPIGFEEGLRRARPTVSSRLGARGDEPPVRRIGIVGMGKMGIVHASLVNALPRARLAAVMDVRSGLGPHLRSLGIVAPLYASLERMLDEVPLDGVIVCVPPVLNERVAAACAERGLGVLLEKPLSATLDGARSLVGLARTTRIANALGYMVAHVPVFREAGRLLHDGAIGTPRHASARVYLSQVFGKKRGWRYQPTQSGGGVVSVVGSHMLFLLGQFFGDAASVRASCRRTFSEQVEDEATGVLTFAGGPSCEFEMSWSRPGYPVLTLELDVVGDNGCLSMANDRVVLTGPDGSPAAPKSIVRRWDLATGVPFDVAAGRYDGDGYYLQDAEFVDCLGTSRAPTVGWEDGYRVQVMTDAIYTAASTGADHEIVTPR
jgi:predicted dehydrogenase/nucleoside-diphosphate-sugar epimerase